MTLYLLYAFLIAFVGTGLLFLIKKRYLATPDERRLAEASEYTIVDATPRPENPW